VARSAGFLTLANTAGAMAGSLAAGFLLLPWLGIEGSIRLLAGSYGLAAACMLLAGLRPALRREAVAFAAAGALFIGVVALFPSGLMERRYLRYALDRFERTEGAVPVEIREGLTETVIYLRRDLLDEPLYYRLVTNNHSMSATSINARRYMKLFVYLPVALHHEPRSALLISYGVGCTAKALTDTASFERIDVVDISRDILEMNRIVYPDPAEYPLEDPRVRVHVEDGRYFLQTTEQRFDLITGEPPPPKSAGVVNLYTQEYFALVRQRLAEGGIVTYWLPVHGLLESDTRAILRAFCEVFEDCTLWAGASLDWILMGTRDARGPVSAAGFRRQWDDPVVGAELRELGFELPEQIGALFMAGADDLRAIAGDTPPLDDDHPKRLSNEIAGLARVTPVYRPWMNVGRARERFQRSRFVKRMWPASLRQASLAYFDHQAVINAYFLGRPRPEGEPFPALHRILTQSPLRSLVLWLARSSADHQRIVERALAQGRRGAGLENQRGAAALAERDYLRAAEHFAEAQRRGGRRRDLLHYRIYALCMAGHLDEAARLIQRSGIAAGSSAEDRRFYAFLTETFSSTPVGNVLRSPR
jgi:spermidine synthase